MKRLTIVALCLTLGLAGGIAVNASDAAKSHQVTTEIVSVDMKAHTITIKGEKGAPMTVPVLDAAIESMKTLKAGEKVTLTCKDDDKGEHVGVVAIKVEHQDAHKS